MIDQLLSQLRRRPLPIEAINLMIICHCHQVTDREIKSVIARGASTLQAVGDACGAGSGCGGCSSEIAAMLFGRRRVLPIVSALLADDLEAAS